ncbi:hypothetical protein J31TS6_31770 [Brevibacillus reuszeri]|nr:hypothetical protein J31TS6_31770 [Brevibacillus reuszeri]
MLKGVGNDDDALSKLEHERQLPIKINSNHTKLYVFLGRVNPKDSQKHKKFVARTKIRYTFTIYSFFHENVTVKEVFADG